MDIKYYIMGFITILGLSWQPKNKINENKINDAAQTSINVKSFGAIGDGVTNDQPAFQQALNEAVNAKKKLYIPTGTYLMSSVGQSQVVAKNIDYDLEIYGDGTANTKIIRGDKIITYDFQSIFVLKNQLGKKINLTVHDFHIDGNARANPLPKGANKYDWQHCHLLFIHATDLYGIVNFRGYNLSFYDPTADGIGIGGSASRATQHINCHNIQSSGRTRTRSDVTVTCTYDSFNISDSNVDRIEVETNAPLQLSKGVTTISNCTINQILDLNYRQFGVPALIEKCQINGSVNLVGYDLLMKDCKIKLEKSNRVRLVANRPRYVDNFDYDKVQHTFEDCEFIIRDLDTLRKGAIYAHSNKINHKKIVFKSCIFNAIGNSPIYSFYEDKNALIREKATHFVNSTFKGKAKHVFAIGTGYFEITNNSFDINPAILETIVKQYPNKKQNKINNNIIKFENNTNLNVTPIPITLPLKQKRAISNIITSDNKGFLKK